MRASKKVKGAVLLTAGAALILGAPTVHADDNGLLGIGGDNGLLGTGLLGDDGLLGGGGDGGGLLNGVQVLNNVDANVPVTACGAGVLGDGDGECEVKAKNKSKGGDDDVTSESDGGILNGLQVLNNVNLNVPVTACGIGALLGDGDGDCEVKAKNKGGGDGDGDVTSESDGGILNGAQVGNNLDANVPVTLCGVGLLLADGDGECEVTSVNAGTGDGDVSSESEGGLLNGLQLLNNVDLNVPVTVCGLAVLGDASGDCEVEATNDDDDGDVKGESRDRDRNGAVRGANLPKTGAAGLALVPFGLALVAGGVALRRRIGAES